MSVSTGTGQIIITRKEHTTIAGTLRLVGLHGVIQLIMMLYGRLVMSRFVVIKVRINKVMFLFIMFN